MTDVRPSLPPLFNRNPIYRLPPSKFALFFIPIVSDHLRVFAVVTFLGWLSTPLQSSFSPSICSRARCIRHYPSVAAAQPQALAAALEVMCRFTSSKVAQHLEFCSKLYGRLCSRVSDCRLLRRATGSMIQSRCCRCSGRSPVCLTLCSVSFHDVQIQYGSFAFRERPHA